MAYSNKPYNGGKLLQSDNEVIDMQTFLESGAIQVTPVASPSVIPTTPATVRNYDNFPPMALKVINEDNEVFDLIEFLKSGALQATMSAMPPVIGPIDTMGYPIINSVDDIVTVDADILKIRNRISGVDTTTYIQFDGADEMDFSVGGEIPFSLTPTDMFAWGNATFNGITLLSGVNIFSGASTFSDNVTINANGGNTNTFHSNVRSFFNLATAFAEEIQLTGSGSQIRATTGHDLKLLATDSNKSVQLLSTVEVDGIIARHNQTTNNITFSNATQDFNIGGVSILNISPNGLYLGNDINLNGFQIISPTGENIRIAPGITALDWIELWANTVNVKESFIFNSTPTDNITHVVAERALYFNLNNTTAIVLSDAGLKLNSGATINNIDNSGTSYSQTDGVTAYSVQQMISAAIDAGVSFRTTWDASGGTFPTTGGTGIAGAIEKGNWWYISVAGTLAGQDVVMGDWITAITNIPGQTGSNWLISFQGVTSVFGRIGPIVATSGDYDFPKISGNIATSQLPNSGVNGASQLVQLNASTQLPAVSGVNLTGLTGALVSSANNLNVAVNGGTASSDVSIVNSISMTSSTNSISATVNGISSSTVNIINSVSLGSSTNTLTSTVNGVASLTANIINTNVLGVSGTNITATINGVASNSLSLGFSNITGTAQISQGGTNATTIGATGTLARSNGTGYTFTTATYPDTAGTSGTILRSNGTSIVNSTATFSDTYSASSLLYSNGASTVTGLATANSAQLVTNSSGVPAWTASMTNGQVLLGSTGAAPVPASITFGNNLTSTVGAGTLQISTANSYGRIGWAIPQSTSLATAVITTGTLTEISSWGGQSFTLQSPNNNFSMTTDGRLKYTGTPTITVSVSYFCAFYNGAGFNYQVSLYKNTSSGTLVDSQSTVNNVSNSEMVASSSGNFVSMSTNDYLSLYITTTGTSKTVGICTVSISALSVA